MFGLRSSFLQEEKNNTIITRGSIQQKNRFEFIFIKVSSLSLIGIDCNTTQGKNNVIFVLKLHLIVMLKKYLKPSLILILSVFMATVLFLSCNTSKATKSMKATQKREAAKQKTAEKNYKALIKEHEKRQADDTRKMMKKMKKKNKKLIRPFKK